jgi:beta-glucosidase
MDLKRQQTRMRTKPALSLAREAARRSIVMLKNEGDLLPLPRKGKRIAIIGPFAEGPSNLHGPWTLFADNKEAVDLASAVRTAVADASMVSIVKGSEITSPIEGGIDAAVAAARAADIVILAVGEREAMSGEAASRDLIVVPPAQQALAEAVAAVGKPMIVALRNGRALALEGAILDAPAILVTWFLGSETGNATADILFGATGPSGRLPVSFPISAGQVPYYYAHRRPGRPNNTRYITSKYEARFPFGHGLTYGKISYSDLVLSSKKIGMDGQLRVTVTVSNHGQYAARVELAPGQSQQVTLDLRAADLAFIGVDLKPLIEAGRFKLWIAQSAEAAGLAEEFEIA